MKKNFLLWMSIMIMTASFAQTRYNVGFEFAPFDTLQVLDGSDLKTTGYTGTTDNDNKGDYFYMPIIWDTAFGGYWSGGWAISRLYDTTEGAADYATQFYAARPGFGYMGAFDRAYAIGQRGSKIYNHAGAQAPIVLMGFHVTNTTFGYNVMKNGNMFAKKFGGSTGNDQDSLVLIVYYHRTHALTQSKLIDTQRIVLADYRFAEKSKDYIIKDWQKVYVDAVQNVNKLDSIEFQMEGSDNDPQFGLNTPGFFAVDGFLFDFFESVEKINRLPMHVSPNPAENRVVFTTTASPKMIQVMDMSGKAFQPQVSGIEKVGNNYEFQMDLSDLAAGVYQVTVRTQSGIETAKVLKAVK